MSLNLSEEDVDNVLDQVDKYYESKNNENKKVDWQCKAEHKTGRIRNKPIAINLDQDQKYILYCTDCNVGENGIALYNKKTDQFAVSKYPQNIQPEYHCYCKYKNYLYIITEDGTVYISNISNISNITEIKKIENIKNKREIGKYSSCINIGDEIHIFGGSLNKYHLIYSIPYKEYIKGQNFGVSLENPCILNFRNTHLLVFGGYNIKATKASNVFFIGTMNKLHFDFYKDENINNETKYTKLIKKWEVSLAFEMAKSLTKRDCGYVLYKHYILVFGGLYSQDIHLLDLDPLEYDQHRWQKLPDIECPVADKFHAVLIDDDIHLFGLSVNTLKHYSLSIRSILGDLCDDNNDILNLKSYTNEELLVSGYVRLSTKGLFPVTINVCAVIGQLCQRFYGKMWTTFRFNRNRCGKNLWFRNDRTIQKTKESNDWSTAVADQAITDEMCDSVHIEYTINQGSTGDCDSKKCPYFHFQFGYSMASIKDWNEDIGYSTNAKNCVSAHIWNGRKQFRYNGKDGRKESKKVGDKYKVGDTVGMIFNFKRNQCTFYHNGIEADTLQSNAKSIIPTVSLIFRGSEYEVTTFELQ